MNLKMPCILVLKLGQGIFDDLVKSGIPHQTQLNVKIWRFDDSDKPFIIFRAYP